MDHLRKEKSPITDAAWELIDDEATRSLRHFLTARALIDFIGPKGWTYSAEAIGKVEPSQPGPAEGVDVRARAVQPVLEMRTAFELSLASLDLADRGAKDVDLDPLVEACRRAALAEDRAVFYGFDPLGVAGVDSSSPHEPIEITKDYSRYPRAVAQGVAALRTSGIGGPYALALGTRCYTGVIETTEHGGYPVLEHCKLIVGGPVVWSPAVDGALLVSQRGGDYEFISGQDLAIGYVGQDGDTVQLYIEESFAHVVLEPDAAIPLRYHE